jgi:hypothetical protein
VASCGGGGATEVEVVVEEYCINILMTCPLLGSISSVVRPLLCVVATAEPTVAVFSDQLFIEKGH